MMSFMHGRVIIRYFTWILDPWNPRILIIDQLIWRWSIKDFKQYPLLLGKTGFLFYQGFYELLSYFSCYPITDLIHNQSKGLRTAFPLFLTRVYWSLCYLHSYDPIITELYVYPSHLRWIKNQYMGRLHIYISYL